MKKTLLKSMLVAGMLAVGMGVQAQKAPVYIETDLTSQFESLTKVGQWNGAQSYTATNFCPKVKTNTGLEVQVIERYVSNCNETGDIFYATVKGLTAGTYKIELYGGAAFTFGRGFSSTHFTGDSGDTNSNFQAGEFIDEDTGVSLIAETSEGKYGGEIPIYYACDFPDGAATVVLNGVKVGDSGQIKIGMSKTSTSTNWHIIQLKGVTAQVDAVELYASLKNQAEEIKNEYMDATALYNLANATVDDTNFTTAAEYQTAIDNLNDALTAANASIEYYKKVGKHFDNVYNINKTIDLTKIDSYKQYLNGSLPSDLNTDDIYIEYAAIALQSLKAVNGTDFTAAIINPGFESGTTIGWTYDASSDHGAKDNSNDTYRIDGIEYGDYIFNIWSSGNKISQTIPNLPNGVYTMSAFIATDAGHQVKLAANGIETVVDASSEGLHIGIEGEVEFTVDDHTATISAEGVDLYWYKVDNFSLKLVQVDVTDGISTIDGDATPTDAIYTLQGQRVAAPVKGVNIIGGKKVMVK